MKNLWLFSVLIICTGGSRDSSGGGQSRLEEEEVREDNFQATVFSEELAAKMMAYQKRLKKEYEELSMRAPTGITLDKDTTEENIEMLVWWGWAFKV